MEKTYYITGNQLWAALRDRVDVTVPTLADRDALMTYQRRWGMLVYVFADPDPDNNGPYFLQKKNDILADNTNWEKFDGGHAILDDNGLELATRPKMKGEDYIEFVNPPDVDYVSPRINPERVKQVEYTKVYQMPEDAKTLLEDPLNWNSESVYIGGALVGCKPGMKHRDADWVYEMFTSTVPVRYPRKETSGDKHYTYSIFSQSYVGIQHNLGKKPAVTVLDTNGNEVFPDILHIDENTTAITFTEIFTGTATFN